MSAGVDAFISALLLQSGYNAALVALGAGFLGIAAGFAGTFLFLRKRALVSDATAHATLPGIGFAFIIMVSFGGDGRNLAGLLIGSALTATLGLWVIQYLSARTRLHEDAAIGAVLSVFFGFGVVLLTIIQNLAAGRAAGLEGFLLGSTAGMLLGDATLIAGAGLLTIAVILVFRRPMTLVTFDPDYAATRGINSQAIDYLIMAVVMAVTVIGLKIVGLILIVAMLIIPPVTARCWSDRTDVMLWLSGLLGGLSGYLGAALSATAAALPTGPIIVLVSFSLFVIAFLFSPSRGVLAAMLRRKHFQARVHLRQGLLALAHGEPIHDPLTLQILRKAKLIRADHVPTDDGRAEAAKARLDEQRWAIARRIHADETVAGRYDGLTPIESVLTADEIAALDAQLAQPKLVGA